jgi:uncharacterized protein YbbK (DUF523 family)/uncharacterized protein YbgA (DUF1722 family)
MSESRPRIAVSACLLGQAVRHDGRDKREGFLADDLGGFVEWVPVCPEVEIGLGVPREPMRLERSGRETLLVAIAGRLDHTEVMRAWAAERVRGLATLDLCGIVLKAHSPSCGWTGVPVFDARGEVLAEERGLFAAAVAAGLPDLPVVEESDLTDHRAKENFVARVFARARWREAVRGASASEAVRRFHEAHRLLLVSRDPHEARRLAGLVAAPGEAATLQAAYPYGFERALRRVPDREDHARALRVALVALEGRAPDPARAELGSAIADYLAARVPLTEPHSRAAALVRTFGPADLAGDAYWEPHPPSLGLLERV